MSSFTVTRAPATLVPAQRAILDLSYVQNWSVWEHSVILTPHRDPFYNRENS